MHGTERYPGRTFQSGRIGFKRKLSAGEGLAQRRRAHGDSM